MKLSYNWLGDYVAHGLDATALADRLTMIGLEVEGIETRGDAFEGVVVGHVLETKPHPNADRLTLCRVDVGAGEPLPIVCGAPNVTSGQRVPVATVGTTLLLPSRENPGERVAVTLGKARIRGEESRGMICAEDELGLSDDHSGIMVLEGEPPAGQPFATYLGGRGLAPVDHVLDVSITPNRPDAVSHIGIARDLAAILEKPLRRPAVDIPEAGGAAAERVAVRIDASGACRRYVAMVIEGVTIGESPDWLKQRLLAVGLRPRNNVVDVTNYVMLECGQPLHAFDYDRVAGHTIVVRQSGAGEAFVTLDGKRRTLPDRTLLICDAERSVAIAGIMGGENSEVTETTANVLLESAYFDPPTIRRTARGLGMQTDASYRFERGVDARGQDWAAARAAALIAELGGGRVVPGVVDAHPNPVPVCHVLMRPSRAERIIGAAIDHETIVEGLRALGFGVAEGALLHGEAALRCTVPGYRPDVEREIDVIEEIARLYGYDNIPLPNHVPVAAIAPVLVPDARVRARAQALLTGLGFREIYTNSMLSHEVASRFNLPVLTGAGYPGEVVATLNPVSQEMAALRPCLLPGMLGVMAHNRNHGHDALRFVEFGHVFSETGDSGVIIPGYGEHTALLVAMSGPAQRGNWAVEERQTDFYDLKGVVEALIGRLEIESVTYEAEYTPTWATSFHLAIAVNGRPAGVLARLSDEAAAIYDLREPVFFAELNWDVVALAGRGIASRRYRPVSRFPAIERDLAIIVERQLEVGRLSDAIRAAGGTLLRSLTVFDVYTGDQVPPGQKSVAFGLRFGADRTLQDEEVDRAMGRILERLERDHGVKLRQ